MFSKQSTNITKVYRSKKYNTTLVKMIEKLLRNTTITMAQFDDLVNDEKCNTDEKLIKQLQKINDKPYKGYSEEADKYRAYGKWKNIKFNIPKQTRSIMDFGGNVGNGAYTLGREILKLPKEKVLCVDIDEWAGESWKPRGDITWIHTNNLEKIPSNSIDVITCFHVLHHIPDNLYKTILSNLYRILSKNGVMCIYEHNASSKEWSYIIELEHMLYDVVLEKKIAYSKFTKTHYSKYLSIPKWTNLFTEYGFNVTSIKELSNLDNSFYMFLYKV
jgi:2-polyprenyl-3-methyl-5-hydroxy-6-metoxy-1,4-benzoquinol methylase